MSGKRIELHDKMLRTKHNKNAAKFTVSENKDMFKVNTKLIERGAYLAPIRQ